MNKPGMAREGPGSLLLAAAVSSVRAEVVPTATTRPPLARTEFSAAAACSGDLGPFQMHDMISDVLDIHGTKGPEPNMERQVDPADSSLGEVLEDRLAEVQPRSGGGDGTWPEGEDRLITGPIPSRFSSLADVGGQGSLSVSFQKGQCRSTRRQSPPGAEAAQARCRPPSETSSLRQSPVPMTTRSPIEGQPRVLARTSQVPSATSRRKSPSHLPPVNSRWPISRAGITRELFRARMSRLSRIAGNSKNR